MTDHPTLSDSRRTATEGTRDSVLGLQVAPYTNYLQPEKKAFYSTLCGRGRNTASDGRDHQTKPPTSDDELVWEEGVGTVYQTLFVATTSLTPAKLQKSTLAFARFVISARNKLRPLTLPKSDGRKKPW